MMMCIRVIVIRIWIIELCLRVIGVRLDANATFTNAATALQNAIVALLKRERSPWKHLCGLQARYRAV